LASLTDTNYIGDRNQEVSIPQITEFLPYNFIKYCLAGIMVVCSWDGVTSSDNTRVWRVKQWM